MDRDQGQADIKGLRSKAVTGTGLNSVLVKPSGPDCNLACTYCFYSGKSGLYPENRRHRMTENVLTEVIRQVMTQAGETLHIAWQGGEPTLVGLPFFRKAMDLICRFGKDQTIGNSLQTNGILIDREWAGFLRQYNFLVGLSLDGPEHIHNYYRVMKDGRGTWSAVRHNAEMMLDEGVCLEVLSVVTDYSAAFPEEIYAFYKDLGMNYMQFTPRVEANPMNPGSLLSFSVSAERYGDFLCRLFDLWLDDFVEGGQTTFIRFFDSVFCTYIGSPPPECTLLEECGNCLVIEHNGDVYSCDFFVEPEWRLGNIHTCQLKDMLYSKRQSDFRAMKRMLPEDCRTCKWLKLCRGGCIKDRGRDPHHAGMSYLCKAFKMFFEHAEPGFEVLAAAWKEGKSTSARVDAARHRGPATTEKIGRNEPFASGNRIQ